jgi:hypothetical protein
MPGIGDQGGPDVGLFGANDQVGPGDMLPGDQGGPGQVNPNDNAPDNGTQAQLPNTVQQ